MAQKMPKSQKSQKETTKKASKKSAELESATDHAHHANHSEDLIRLKRIRGQIEGVERMIEGGRYCMDIVNQIRSTMAALRSVEGLVMERHIRHCVKDAISAKDQRETETKINELLILFNKR